MAQVSKTAISRLIKEKHKVTGNDLDDDTKTRSRDDFKKQKELEERYTVRNLRIREDTAKYLRNLDLSSAYYDPKTRSMRKKSL